ncbi:conserved hypothetical protein [Xenorhabdus nematophila F1]|uniref:Uncharacterized protein n=1 Tax=Xenorhabdus nematophila (strain ATCC 19061 / DSM 3370 / CCUG 14189 / LMG 1036 / NCIMB 9965 / AN6) TaxID=406817 RepID=D3VDR1_XENNA|nr:hypothetical protein XNC1_1918 [Xenorhabdus nematophila ATCC 19061]CCW30126.1 conserved hypothetical protein [Xenorhabdus nematophila F1]CEE94015.1 hypothetical protein XNA1_4470011 [Xenorhabdus nematophila str. Anatoliense]CEF30550.1 hypothetical protein XNW1_2650023 [Xenorhabdus nematophila str. Websteri]CEK22853.1 hypothetical protein XNC2_1859 [Xenorhabdus nematophila AN6/1]
MKIHLPHDKQKKAESTPLLGLGKMTLSKSRALKIVIET